jgi:hypothetical protein
MGSFVICAFRPKAGMEQGLLEVVRDHMPTLRTQDLITDRSAYVMRASDGTILEIFEWKSAEHTRQAHENPVVRKLWKRFEEVCDYISLRDVPGTDGPFPHFEPIDLA